MTGSKQASSKAGAGTATNVWTEEERAAMRAGARERKAASRHDPAAERAEGEAELQAKIAGMPEPDRAMATRVHAIVTKAVPSLVPKTYYGMPAYAKDGKVICFFKPKSKFKVRYATFEFQADANLDDGAIWPVSFALKELTAGAEAQITALVKRAVS
jgi:hypothetical protein